MRDELKPLVGDPAREAVDALRGFDHQVWHTVLEWLRLPPDHQLYVEGAEDLDRHGDGIARATQIKDVGRSVTLKNVLGPIVDFWGHQSANPLVTVHFAYLTTAPRGLERDRPFGNVQGLDRWDECRKGGDLADLRAFLLRELATLLKTTGRKNESAVTRQRRESRTALVDELCTFLRGATEDEIRERLVRRITWETDSAAQPEVVMEAKRLLVSHGESVAVMPTESELVLNHLVQHVWSVAKGATGERWLRRNDWLAIFEKVSTVPVSRSVARQYMAAAGAAPPASDSTHRRHDLKVLSAFSRHVHWDLLREFVEDAPKRYHGRVIPFEAALNEFVTADFFLYDTVLADLIRQMSAHWEEVLGITVNYSDPGAFNQFSWPTRRMLTEVERMDWERANVCVAALRTLRQQVLDRLRSDYPEIDLRDGSALLWNRMMSDDG
jgi:hypothetical protein